MYGEVSKLKQKLNYKAIQEEESKPQLLSFKWPIKISIRLRKKVAISSHT